MDESMLSTIDNPYDPFTQFDLWYHFDTAHGYQSSALLARVCVTSDSLSPPDQSLAIEQAIDEIVRENVSGVHIKVTKNSSEVS